MKKRGMKAVIVCSVLAMAGSGFSDIYGRDAGGFWQETNSTWKIGGSYVSTLPGSADTVSLTSGNQSIDLFSAAVTVSGLTLGAYDATFTKTITLNVQTNFTTVNAITIGSAASNTGNGAMVVSNATVATAGSTLIGKTAAGSLTLNGAVFSNSAWRVDMGAQGTVALNGDSILSMVNGLLMVDGARVDINGGSELWIMGNDQTQTEDPIMQYIAAGWIYGNGTAGNVQAAWDGTKTIVTANTIPEPATISLMVISCSVLLLVRKHFRA